MEFITFYLTTICLICFGFALKLMYERLRMYEKIVASLAGMLSTIYSNGQLPNDDIIFLHKLANDYKEHTKKRTKDEKCNDNN